MAETGEKRRDPRHDVLKAIMVRPNGEQHASQVIDISISGARLRLPEDWNPADGAHLRMYFGFDGDPATQLEGRVTRVAIDHLGVEFDQHQETRIRALLETLLER